MEHVPTALLHSCYMASEFPLDTVSQCLDALRVGSLPCFSVRHSAAPYNWQYPPFQDIDTRTVLTYRQARGSINTHRQARDSINTHHEARDSINSHREADSINTHREARDSINTHHEAREINTHREARDSPD
jgi:hypothetical protein